jgi:MurNAc alpha-1-phosphate uridylyltransferase
MLTFSGIGVYRPALFAAVARGTRAPLAPLLREAAARGRVTGELFRGRWLDIGTPERLAALDSELKAGRA